VLNHLLRYAPVLDALEALDAATLLEVRSGSRGIAAYAPARLRVTACDVAFDDYRGDRAVRDAPVRRVQASVLDLPFADAAFDVVLALDLLEHLPPADGPRAVAERRVADRTLIVGCLTGGPALRADERLARWIGLVRHPSPGWLDEHLRHGFPEPGDLVMRAGGANVRVLADEHAWTHIMVCSLEATPGLRRMSLGVHRLLAPAFARAGGPASAAAAAITPRLRGFDARPAYGTILITHRPSAV
jgi:hypothetical protein